MAAETIFIEDSDASNDKQKISLPQPGIGLCLSGGGYRAIMFHLGTLWRLNEFGYLKRINRISSVSGGTIAAAWLASVWDKLNFNEAGVAQNFEAEVATPLRAFTTQNLDAWIILLGLLNPLSSIGETLAWELQRHLYGQRTLQQLPDELEFVFNASNAQSGVLWRFSKAYMRDWEVGEVKLPNLPLATAVAASAAFPPFISPVRLLLKSSAFTPNSGTTLQYEPFTSNIVLMDGGVYDNLGLEPVLKRYETVLVSDAGTRLEPDERPRLFWGLQAFRVLNMMDSQVRALRKRQLIEMYVLRKALIAKGMQPSDYAVRVASREGSYWSTYSNMDDYKTDHVLDCPYEKTLKLAQISTRLWGMSYENQEHLINWGYAICDAAMRKYVEPTLPANPRFPYAEGLG